MSFLSGIADFGKSLFGGGLGTSLLTTALAGIALNQVSKSVNKPNTVTATATVNTPDPGVRLQLDPDTQHKIPIVYGSATLGGIITDANLTNNNKLMSYCITISEKTGTKFSDSLPSVTTFEDIYWNDQRIIFKADGVTISYTIDRDGNIDPSLSGLVQIFCFDGGSGFQVIPDNYSAVPLYGAADVMPNWTANHLMTNLIFSIIKVTYSKEKNLTQIGDIKFHITNSMTLPGDCLYDYMMNTNYGAGITAEEIYSA